MHDCGQIDVGNFLGCFAKMLHLCHFTFTDTNGLSK